MATVGTQLCSLECRPETSGSPMAQRAVCTPILSSPAEAVNVHCSNSHIMSRAQGPGARLGVQSNGSL